MNSDEFGWMIIRAFGLYFAYLASVYVIALVGQTSTLVGMYSIESRLADMAYTIWIRLGTSAIQLVLYGLAIYYCFWRGAWIHKLLVHGIADRRS